MRTKFILIIPIYLLVTSCSTIVGFSTSRVVGPRWIDNENLVQLIQYSEGNNIKTSDIFNFLGEPVYIEQYSIGDNQTTLLWYLYKSKYYPILEVSNLGNSNNTRLEKIEKQIKPESFSNYNVWENDERWIVAIVNKESYELILMDLEDEYKPWESKKYYKNLIKDLGPEAAKALLENNN